MNSLTVGMVFFEWYWHAAVICFIYLATRGYVSRKPRPLRARSSDPQGFEWCFKRMLVGSAAACVAAIVLHWFDRRGSFGTQFGECAAVILPAIWVADRTAAREHRWVCDAADLESFERAQMQNRMVLGTLRHNCSTETLHALGSLEKKVSELLRAESHVAHAVLPHLIAEAEKLLSGVPREELDYVRSRLDCIFEHATLKPVVESSGPYE